jgi:hypothetical protein
MMERLAFIAAMFTAAATSASFADAPQGASSCPTQIDQAQLHLAYDAFDTSQWRNLLSSGCTDAAVALLAAYLSANQSQLTPDQVRTIHFHMGQAYAMSGRNAESIPHFQSARAADAPQEWSAYVDATLAFLQHDATALAAARTRYAAAAHASEMRLSVIDGFVACPDRSYMDAVQCGMHSGQ